MVKIRENYPSKIEEMDYAAWMQRLSAERTPEDIQQLELAFNWLQELGKDKSIISGQNALYQGMMMADILNELRLDVNSLSAALLYEVVDPLDLNSLKMVNTRFPPQVTSLLYGLRNVRLVWSKNVASHSHLRLDEAQIQNLRKMLLAVVEDVRVVLLRLAQHTCEMRHAVHVEAAVQKRLAIETQLVYAPLANRLGIGQLKWELEDLAFRYLEPILYKRIANWLHERRIDREKYIQELIKIVQEALASEGIEAKVTGRVKHIYSIWKKMQKKRISYHEVYDVRAIRILVKQLKDCYAALGIVHSLWQHVPKEFDDYIANPKPNGYRSLHTAVVGPQGKTLEVQIRTQDMHDQAELGVAAHWLYKEDRRFDPKDKAKWDNLYSMIKSEEFASEDDAQDLLRAALSEEQVYVFTPQGKVIDLPQSATPLDFAYYVHTELGHRCRGAKVNGKMVPLTYALKSGEQVEIITAKVGAPSRDWLNPQLGYIKTPRARAKVLQWLRKQARDENLLAGRQLLEKELKRLGLDDEQFSLEQVAKKFNHAKADDFLAALGAGDVRITQLFNLLRPLLQAKLPKSENELVLSVASTPQAHSEFMVSGVGDLLCTVAKCCTPVPGDAIAGFITQGRGVTIHRSDCLNMAHARELNSERLIPVDWGHQRALRYAVNIAVHASDRPGLVRDISAVLTSERTNVVTFHTQTSKAENTADFKMTIEVADVDLLSALLHKLQQIPNVIEVYRVK
ncbi:MAG: GTP diphosphokinase [Gammaproteobacteria bacterium]